MKGQWDKQECVSEWQKYRACLSVGLHFVSCLHASDLCNFWSNFNHNFWQQHLEDKHLVRFLQAEGIVQESGVTSQ